MNGRRTKTTNAKKQTTHAGCLCQGFGPALTEFLQRVGPPDEARRHFESARVEVLKGLRAILDKRIDKVTGTKAKGEKIKVE